MPKLYALASGLAALLCGVTLAAAQEPPPAAPAPAAAPPPAPTAAQAAPPAAAPPAAAPAVSPSKGAGAVLDAIGALLEQKEAPPVGNAVAGPLFPEERTPPGDPENPKAFRFALHGYFRAPLRFGWQKRVGAAADEAGTNIHAPRLVDDDYFHSGFLYTRNPESDFSELYLMAGNQYLTGTVALEGSLYSDPARPVIDNQLGISKGFLTFRYGFDLPGDVKLRLKVKGGAFSDRFGWQEKYDTYLFGRTHQMGEQVRADLDVGKLSFSALQGFGAHLGANNQGFTLLNYMRLGASYDRLAEASFYYLRAWTTDKQGLSMIEDGSLRVLGAEVRVDSGGFGRLAVAVSQVAADKASWLAPAIELMHSAGGRGLEENYFGTEKSDKGTGAMLNLGFQYDFSTSAFLKKVADVRPFGEGDINLSFFGMYAKVASNQIDPDPTVNRDGRQYFKWGTELSVWPVSFLGASLRYDRVIADIHDDPSAFRILSPRITLRTHWIADAMIFLQYSHYMYGERITLRPGQLQGEAPVPDSDVFKIQGQLGF
jgi:hypothetical protein